jgi:transcriptional regulator with XRE-family HTH domain
MTDIPETLKRLRVASGYTQKQVAEKVKRSESQISEVENGRANPSYDLLMNLLDVYKASFIILPVAEQSEFTALDKDALLLIAQAGHDLAVAVDGMGDASTDLSVRMMQVERAVRRYWELLEALGIVEKGHENE